jgi:hypothetical protein
LSSVHPDVPHNLLHLHSYFNSQAQLGRHQLCRRKSRGWAFS